MFRSTSCNDECLSIESDRLILFRLLQIFGWMPEFYNDTEKLPSNMPEDLKSYIKEEQKINPTSVSYNLFVDAHQLQKIIFNAHTD